MLGEEVVVKKVIDDIDRKLRERMSTATMKECLVYYKEKGRLPGFMDVYLRFSPNFGSTEVADMFQSEVNTVTDELKDIYYERIIRLCDTVLHNQMKNVHEVLQKAVNSLDINDA